MKLSIGAKTDRVIQEGMMGLFFEDINYAADGGLYAEMIENRSFEFVKAVGDRMDYYTEYDGSYGWQAYPSSANVRLNFVSGSPLSEENPHYMRVVTLENDVGFSNKAYEGIYLRKDIGYKVTFFARCVNFSGDFSIFIEKNGFHYAEATLSSQDSIEGTYNYFKKYEVIIRAKETVEGAKFVICLSTSGIVEFDFISMFPQDAVAGIFRKDLFDKLKDLAPGFIRFPGGCIIEGNTLANRYRFKDSLKVPWDRKSNWNRWAVHGNSKDNEFLSEYAHYNQTLGLGYYEYFLLCELIGAKPLPVLNVGLACQYQSEEMVSIESFEFRQFIQDAIDLIEFANGDTATKWGALRKDMGHEEPFNLELLGIGNEQWQTTKVDFFERYVLFEKAIHEYAPYIKLIGSAGPDITSERYQMAWDFYYSHKERMDFVYAVDEHYYVKPEWLYEHVDFYDNYPRSVKVFAGEYAAHPCSGMNRPDANTLGGALSEAAFLTGIERNADVVIMASYAPLLARIGYAQWSPDMIWFDDKISYVTPNYHVQKMYMRNMGDVTLDTLDQEKSFAKERIYYSLSYKESTDEIIIKVVNANLEARSIDLELSQEWQDKKQFKATILRGKSEESYNCLAHPQEIEPYEINGEVLKGITLPPLSFSVIKIF